VRLSGWLSGSHDTPESWIAAVQNAGYRAAIWPLALDAADSQVQAYVQAARDADILIAEVGAWHNNPLSPDPAVRQQALENCKHALEVADRIGALCCVNVAGSRGDLWDGPHPDNLTGETFAMIVASVQGIIDAVQPTNTFYTLEPMPWIYPDSPDSYLRLIEAVDRPAFAVHFDPVNIISSPQRYFNNGAFLRECFQKLGPYIKSCHAKDIILRNQLTVHFDEVPPGQGTLDYGTFLKELARLDDDIPLIIEHIRPEDIAPAIDNIRAVAERAGVQFR
jgi:sugar phosphate isomerase/epimerase